MNTISLKDYFSFEILNGAVVHIGTFYIMNMTLNKRYFFDFADL